VSKKTGGAIANVEWPITINNLWILTHMRTVMKFLIGALVVVVIVFVVFCYMVLKVAGIGP
jgi:hypothetical protein